MRVTSLFLLCVQVESIRLAKYGSKKDTPDISTREDTFNEDVSMLQKVCEHPEETPSVKWQGLEAMANALNKVNAPYNIDAGTVLGLVRGCHIFDDDIDFAIDFEWLKKNYNETMSAIYDAGFEGLVTFGKWNETGHEKAFRHWTPDKFQTNEFEIGNVDFSSKDLIPGKVDFASDGLDESLILSKTKFTDTLASLSNMDYAKLQHRSGVRVDLFTTSRTSDGYEWGLWQNGHLNPCTAKSTGIITFSWRGVDVKVPVPLKDYLVSLYGENYMTPQEWTWNVDPFVKGSCRRA